MSTAPPNVDNKNGLPPFVSSWRQLYGLVLLNLILTIGLLWAFTLYFQ